MTKKEFISSKFMGLKLWNDKNFSISLSEEETVWWSRYVDHILLGSAFLCLVGIFKIIL
jgi:hypothetical protein